MQITSKLLVSVFAVVLAASACSQSPAGIGGAIPAHRAARPASGTSAYVQHVIVVIQENRSFDNFFATFPGADGATGGCEKPLTAAHVAVRRTSGTHGCQAGDRWLKLKKVGLDQLNLGHQHFSFDNEFDKGHMDGFNKQSLTLQRGQKVPAGDYAYRYTNPDDIQPYWAIANQFVLGDHMFTTQSSDSFTGHQDLIAGGTPAGDNKNVIDFPIPSSWGCDAGSGTVTSLINTQGQYERGKGPYPCFSYTTMRDLLDAQDVSWAYYANAMNGYVWNAFEAISAVRNGPEWGTNIVIPQTKILTAIKDGTLPAVSWLTPDALDSDHPGNHSDSGPSWIAQVVNAVGESSTYWPDTVVIVVWDDWGGQFDHVAPPQLDGQGLGMRVPMLLVSAYARETSSSQPGYVSHTQYEFGSILKFIETNWGLGNLGRTDVRANNLLDSFNFNQPPRTFTPIKAKYSRAYFLHRPPSGLPLDDD